MFGITQINLNVTINEKKWIKSDCFGIIQNLIDHTKKKRSLQRFMFILYLLFLLNRLYSRISKEFFNPNVLSIFTRHKLYIGRKFHNISKYGTAIVEYVHIYNCSKKNIILQAHMSEKYTTVTFQQEQK